MMAGTKARDPKVTVVIPGHNASTTIAQCLSAVAAQEYPSDRLEIIYVDDASDDESATIASSLPCKIIRLSGRPYGPAAARNAGVGQAAGEIIVFFDADVLAPPQTVRKLVDHLTSDIGLHAVFGSYDLEPSATNFVSQYRNLLHHFVHQTSRGEAATFWAGCGAVRKDSFRTAGGFDAAKYSRAMIEDIDLGHRMKALGMRIALDRLITVKHLKRWTLLQMIKADIFHRGIPWVRLLLQGTGMSGEIGDLNLRFSAFISVVLAWAAVGLSLLAFLNSWFLPLLIAVLISGFLISLPLCRFFFAVRGFPFALMSAPLLFIYHLYNGISVTLALSLQLRDGFMFRMRALASAARR